MQPTTYSKWRKLLVYVVVSLVLYVGIRTLLGAVFPFFIAILLLKLFYPLADWIKKHLRIGKGVSVFFLFLLLLGIVGCGLWFLLQNLLGQVGDVFSNMSTYEGYAQKIVKECCCKIEKHLGLRADYMQPFLLERLYHLGSTLKESISQGIMSYSYQYAKGFVKLIGILVVVMVATVLIAKDYDKLKQQFIRLPFYENITQLKETVFYALFIYVRAQVILILIISVVCCVSFSLMGVKSAVLLGTGIGVLDALPFFGTGSILIPWAVIQIFRGKMLSAAVLGTVYIVCSCIREFLEPKLIGKKLGVLPVYIISTVYIGIVLYGFGGVLLGPLQALLTLEIGRQWIADHEKT